MTNSTPNRPANASGGRTDGAYARYGREGQPMNDAARAEQLAPAPTNVEPPKPPAPAIYDAEILFETAEGFHVLLRGRDLTPKDSMAWAKLASAQLAAQGFKPVRRDVVVNVEAPAPTRGAQATAGAAVGEASWVKGTGGAPPSCSLHGVGKYVTGTYKPDHQKAGQSFAFWGCTVRGCRPKGEPV